MSIFETPPGTHICHLQLPADFIDIQVPADDLQIDELVQERRNSSALAMELHLSCTNPSK